MGALENDSRRKGKIEAYGFVWVCYFMDVEITHNTLVTLCRGTAIKMRIYNLGIFARPPGKGD